MGKETVLFKSEEKLDVSAAAQVLRQLADKIEAGEVTLSRGRKKSVLQIPGRVELEIKAEREQGKRTTEEKLEVELEWVVGDSKDSGSLKIS